MLIILYRSHGFDMHHNRSRIQNISPQNTLTATTSQKKLCSSIYVFSHPTTCAKDTPFVNLLKFKTIEFIINTNRILLNSAFNRP